LDYKKLSSFKEQVVKGLAKGVELILQKSGVNIVSEEGNFLSERKLELASGEIIEFDYAIIATGSKNKELPFFKTDNMLILDSTGILNLLEIPASMLVIGAGAIGLELGVAFSRLGTEVTVVEMMPEILPEMERELAGMLRNILTKEGMNFHLNSTVEKVEIGDQNKIDVKISSKDQKLIFDKVLLAVGRAPNTESLAALNLESIAGSFIKVDDKLNTCLKGIKAIGDVTGPPLLAHKASHQGLRAVEDFVSNGNSEEFPPIPSAVFTEPEFASIGLTKIQAEEKGFKVFEYAFPLQAVSRARTMGASEGAFKIISDERGKILGVHILAPGAGDLISEATLAITNGLKVKDLAETIHVHPTLSEGTMEMALLAQGKAIHI
jgi:dihydrolipoamide dehydrogenase